MKFLFQQISHFGSSERLPATHSIVCGSFNTKIITHFKFSTGAHYTHIIAIFLSHFIAQDIHSNKDERTFHQRPIKDIQSESPT
jgi:hypothetical protein